MAYDKLVDSGALDTGLTSIADKIRSRSGGSNQLLFPTGFVSEIDNIPQGGGSVEEKDVNFYDYDGSLVASYTAAEFAALSAMPSNPTHEGLTAQGWNWSLAEAKTYVASYGKLNIGQMYVTASGATEIDIQFDDIARNTPTLGFALNGTAVIDWGDGTSTDTVTGTSLNTTINTQHTYSAPGDYTIKISVASGSVSLRSSYGILYDPYNASSRIYQNMVKAVRIGSNVVSIGNYAFYYCYALESVTIPSDVTDIGQNAFNSCYSLKSVTIPSDVTAIGQNVFGNCYALESVTIPSGVTSIGTYAFYNCYQLESVTIPSSVTSIGTYAFYNCYVLESVTISSSVTSIGNSVFNGCRSLKSVTIPEGTTEIAQSEFSNCYSLIKVTIPSSVNEIKSSAFSGNYSMKEYHIRATYVPLLTNSNSFNGTPSDCIFYVPAGTLEDYQTDTNWGIYASQMQEE